MANEFSHATVGTSITQAEFESTGLHTADSQAQGDILYCDGTYWKRLGAGTDGQYLKTQGAGANPAWANVVSWSTWAPTVTQSSAAGVTVNDARYCKIDTLAIVYADITINSSGAAGTAIQVGGLPGTVQPGFTSNQFAVGSGLVADQGTADYCCSVIASSSAAFTFIGYNTAGGSIGVVPSFAIANTDHISFTAHYRTTG